MTDFTLDPMFDAHETMDTARCSDLDDGTAGVSDHCRRRQRLKDAAMAITP